MVEPLSLCSDLVARGRQLGADEVEAYYSEQATTSVDVSEGQLESFTSAANRGVGLRVLVGGAFGYAYSSDSTEQGPAELLERAVRLAREATPDPLRALPDPRPVRSGDLGIFDPDLEAFSTEDKIQLLSRLERVARETDGRVRNTHLARYSDAIGTYAIVSSRGISASFRSTGCYAALSAIARDDGEAQRGYGVTGGHGPRDLRVEEAGRRAALRAVAPLAGGPVPTQRAAVVMEPEIVAELLRGVTQALSAEAVLKGRSIFVDRAGERVGSALVTLSDDGSLPGGLSSTPVDGEGVPTERTSLIEGGVLRGFLHNTHTARRAGARSTGNGVRGSYRVPPEVGPTNLRLAPGTLSVDDLLSGVERGLYVVATRNVGGINPISGDYSVGASGRWIERGELAGPVTGVTIAAPMLDMLANLSALANDLRWLPGQGVVGAPTVRIDDVTIGGR
jgi:PmbA protein